MGSKALIYRPKFVSADFACFRFRRLARLRIQYPTDREVALFHKPIIRFLFRSISRKITIWLFAVVFMFSMLCVSSVIGLQSYKTAIEDLELCANDIPRQGDLALAFSGLLQYLQMDSQTENGAQFREDEFNDQLTVSISALDDYHRKFDQLPQRLKSSEQLSQQWLGSLGHHLTALEKRKWRLNDGIAGRNELKSRLATLLKLVDNSPNKTLGAQLTTLQAGRDSYYYLSRTVYAGATMAAFLSLILIFFGYSSVFCRIRAVHRGARRVASGDFDYRLVMQTDDEMGELAKSFNMMTSRFQDIERDLENQVKQRSHMLLRSQRLAGVGFLAAGVAHEINNPLAAVSMAAESLSSRVDELFPACPESEKEYVRSYLDMIQSESLRCKDITRKLLDFSTGESATTGPNDVVQIVNDVLRMVGHLSKFDHHTIEFKPQPACLIEINGPQIKQVVLNLVANALESMVDPGRLVIEVIEQTDDVILQFKDNGCGMTADVIDNLFEPFFTQKPVGKGTGLGLSITDRIVQQHGGLIEATSDGANQGSMFRVRLPRTQANESSISDAA